MPPSALQHLDWVDLPGGVRIRLAELAFAYGRSPGPGGQHVNKANTRVELRFDLEGSPSLPEELRRRARARLGSRLTRSGQLVIHASRHRSQWRNRLDCVQRFAALMAQALRPPPPPRRRLQPSRAAVARRLEHKRRQAQKKLRRRPPGLE